MKILKILLVIAIIFAFVSCTDNTINDEPEVVTTPNTTSVPNENPKEDDMFSEDKFLAIGYVNDDNESDMISKYFADETVYNNLAKYDFGTDKEYTDKFVVIQKNANVLIDICTCGISESGEVFAEKKLEADISEPFIFLFDDFESIMPHYALLIKYETKELLVPITFSGYDGSLAIDSYEGVFDITLY